MTKAIPLLTIMVLIAAYPLHGQQQKLQLGGYGEIHYNDITYNKEIDQTPGVFDIHRFVLETDYNFSDNIYLRSGLRVSQNTTGTEMGLSFDRLFVDIELEPEFNIRAGVIPVPVGITNLSRKPTDFHGVERPNTEIYIIPTSWNGAGFGAFGELLTPDLTYQGFILTGLNPGGITGLNGIRNARQSSLRSSIGNTAIALRLSYRINPDLDIGASYYLSTLNTRFVNGTAEKVPSLNKTIYNMGEGHFTFTKDRFEAKGLFALSRILKVGKLNQTFGNGAGQIQAGGYLEIAYDLFPAFAQNINPDQQLYVFGRYESYDTNFTTGAIERTNEYLRDDITIGFSYKPVQDIVFKMDYQILTSFIGSKHVEQLNFGVGFVF